MKKVLLLLIFVVFASQAQTDKFWSPFSNKESVIKYKGVERESFPKQFDLYQINLANVRQTLFSNVENKIITLPNTSGVLEQFEMFEASNFDSELQARFPEIRAYSGKGITDKYATLKLSISPQGIQTMVFRTGKVNEFMEKYSQDGLLYAVFNSSRSASNLSWSCGTKDADLVKGLTFQANSNASTSKFNDGKLRVMRLAQSCTAEYANYFGATDASQVALVLAAFNATLARCNGVYEKDLGLHLNIVNETTNIIYYDPATDPYTTLANWNTQLQIAINTTLTGPGTPLATNNTRYDIGHLFGASGGGGNAGCIGCVCVNGVAAGTGATKGRGITSPGSGGPLGDKFDIDYVVHEVGHQLGGTHTFSNANEGSGTNIEVGSGVTIMGYAGITAQDVATNSIDIYHAVSIQQIQTNLATKTCPVTTVISAANATPVANAGQDYTIPKSTSFILTGSATDANPNDALTYCWEQYDNDDAAQTGAASAAFAIKPTGPNFRSYSPVAQNFRYFPNINSVVANSQTTAATGNDALNVEALSSVARTLTFRLTARDNAPYSSVAPLKVGQTGFDDMVVAVDDVSGPFVVNAPNTAVSWPVGSSQNVSWNVAGTTANGVNTPAVDIFLSIDGGFTYPITLATNVPNNGSATIIVPNNVGTTNRIMVKGYQHIFFDISNVNFTIAAATNSFSVAASGASTLDLCNAPSSAVYTISYSALGGFSGTTTFSATGNPAGSTVVFSPATMSSTSGPVTMTVNGLTTAPAGSYTVTASATSGASTQTVPFFLNIGVPNVVLTTPANNANTQNTTLTLSWSPIAVATSYDVQVSTSPTFASIFSSGNSTTTSYSVTGLAQGTLYYWRVLAKNATCTGVYGQPFNFTTANIACSTVTTNVPVTIPAIANTVPFDSPITIPSTTGTISDINVNVNISHTYLSDITVSLVNPAGTVIVLLPRSCGADDNIIATFDDSGSVLTCAAAGTIPVLSGLIIPATALSTFNGQNPAGVWKLRVTDPFNVDGGTINGWGLNICTATLGTQSNQFTDFALFPNPNNGNFNLRFTSNSSNDIKVSVNDMRGRLVYDNSFQNSGVFNQEININKVQAGVYLVTVTDGEIKTTKRIIVE
jgi:subtilisin-like proprotein convertase family protein